jgi:hypothetical protein
MRDWCSSARSSPPPTAQLERGGGGGRRPAEGLALIVAGIIVGKPVVGLGRQPLDRRRNRLPGCRYRCSHPEIELRAPVRGRTSRHCVFAPSTRVPLRSVTTLKIAEATVVGTAEPTEGRGSPSDPSRNGWRDRGSPFGEGWILAVAATVCELSLCRVSLCVHIVLIGEV